MKGQFFLVSTVIIVGVLLGIYQSFQDYSSVDLSEPMAYSEAFVLKNIIDVSEKLGRSLQYKASCNDIAPFEEMKYYFESKASGSFFVDYNYTLSCANGLLRNAYYNVTVLSNRARYFAMFNAAPFDGYTIMGECDSVQYELQDVLDTKDAFRSNRIEKSCDNVPGGKFLWKKDNAYMAFKVSGVAVANFGVKAYTEQAGDPNDADTFSVESSANGKTYSACGGDKTGSGSWIVSASCSCPGCTDFYVRIKAKDTGSVPNVLRKVELAFS